jgi:hypothetical protein
MRTGRIWSGRRLSVLIDYRFSLGIGIGLQGKIE